MFRLNSSVIGVSLLSLLVSLGVHAQDTTTTVVEKRVMVSPAPKATCTTVEAHWQGSNWITSHEVCKYENRKEGVAWINSYWSCTEVAADGSCTTWTLVPGYWAKTLD